MTKFTLSGQVVVIAGGSQGLGKEFARKFFQEGTNNTVVVVSRSRTKLQQAVRDISGQESAQELTKATQVRPQESEIVYATCDLADYSQVENLYEILASCSLKPTVVLLCAGGSTPGLFKDLKGSDLELGVKVNYMTCVNLAHIAVRHWQSAHLMFFSSEVAFFPFIGYAQYAPLKQSIKSLVAILRQECPQQRISCVYPGNFDSEGYVLENETKPSITREIEGPSEAISCEECCNRIVRVLNMGYDDITTDLIGWFLMSTDMGMNKQNNVSLGWPLQWLLGIIANLVIVPIYMLICKFQIKKWHSSCEKQE
ncbi:LANO_0H01948g1_1 [Lachancea nothofagi CBS 11611]|uniref:3-ketodihydrosphingosine reductase TSC10 n=1 Tax=Lachancea nothofagi CBS 11611 TaxID=1266666 RepID=A0A1G4KL88_9SACH|nr:LANO_0H01948g1_1 [Lachancea nothofagi CBS 11611]